MYCCFEIQILFMKNLYSIVYRKQPICVIVVLFSWKSFLWSFLKRSIEQDNWHISHGWSPSFKIQMWFAIRANLLLLFCSQKLNWINKGKFDKPSKQFIFFLFTTYLVICIMYVRILFTQCDVFHFQNKVIQEGDTTYYVVT